MHIFCDESGGKDKDLLLISALHIEPHQARRFIHEVRRATKVSGEVKGHKLTPIQRESFFRIMEKYYDTIGAVVICSKNACLGKWAMGAVNEPELWSCLIVESCLALPNKTHSMKIMVDGGRYRQHVLKKLRSSMIQCITERYPGMRVTIDYGESLSIDGLQIADVIANTVYQAEADRDAETIDQALVPMRASTLLESCKISRQLTIQYAQLDTLLSQLADGTCWSYGESCF